MMMLMNMERRAHSMCVCLYVFQMGYYIYSIHTENPFDRFFSSSFSISFFLFLYLNSQFVLAVG